MKVYNILRQIDNATTDYIVIKQKVGHKYYDLVRYKNNALNRLFLSIKRFNKDKELYIVPGFKGTEGYYYIIN